jgi:cupin 2 domain-containing protein
LSSFARGHLPSASGAPPVGERTEEIARVGDVVVEHILSGELESPVDYDQDHEEWVVVLDGRAVVEVGGHRLNMTGGDWLSLPAHVPHRLIDTEPGTSWLALHARPPA